MLLIAAPMASSGGSGITLLLPLILIVGMIWFMSRSQRKQRQRQAQTVAALVPGTRFVTTSGQLGTVEEVDDEYVTLEIADGVLVQFVKQAIGRVLPDEVDEYEEEEVEEDGDLEDDHETADDRDTVTDRKDVTDRETVDDKPTLPPTHTEK
jgi:preprotein translocase subunit YajC